MRKIVVWRKLSNGDYYHKIVNGYYAPYCVGYKNQYNHIIVDIIDLPYNYKRQKISIIYSAINLVSTFFKLITKFLDKIMSYF